MSIATCVTDRPLNTYVEIAVCLIANVICPVVRPSPAVILNSGEEVLRTEFVSGTLPFTNVFATNLSIPELCVVPCALQPCLMEVEASIGRRYLLRRLLAPPPVELWRSGLGISHI